MVETWRVFFQAKFDADARVAFAKADAEARVHGFIISVHSFIASVRGFIVSVRGFVVVVVEASE